MEKKNKFIFLIILFLTLFVIGICAYLIYNNKDLNTTDALKFRNEYMNYNNNDYINVYLNDVNTVKYKTADEIIDIIENGKGIIYFGYPTSNACRSIVSIIAELGIELKSDISYLNIEDIRSEYEVNNKNIVNSKKGSKSYYKILDLLNNYLEDYYLNGYNTFEKRIFAPTIIAVDKGRINGIYYFKEENKILDSESIENAKKDIKKVINSIVVDVCTKEAC